MKRTRTTWFLRIICLLLCLLFAFALVSMSLMGLGPPGEDKKIQNESSLNNLDNTAMIADQRQTIGRFYFNKYNYQSGPLTSYNLAKSSYILVVPGNGVVIT